VKTIKTYISVEEIEEGIDKKIADTKSELGEYLRKLDTLRVLAEKAQKIRDTVMKLAGKKTGTSEDLGEVDLGNLKIVLDANPIHELAAIEGVVRSLQEYLFVLQNTRVALKPLDQLGDTEGLNFMILENQGVPERILLKST
jgi:hypothetical protein